MKLIPLTQGYSAMVDDEDYERVSQFKWHAFRSRPGGVYAYRNVWERGVGSKGRMSMHAFIVGFLRPDHKDGDGLNNQKSNLRAATRLQNLLNRRKTADLTSRFKGVSRDRKRWVARIYLNGVRTYLGTFADECDAAQAYNFAAAELFGEFAWFNTPLVDALVK